MFRKYLNWYRRQVLLWQLHNHQGWLEEINLSERRVREARQRTLDAIAMTRVRLAKLDGEAMLRGTATVIVR